MEASPLLLPALVGVLVVVPLALIRAYRAADEGSVDEWAGAHDLALTPQNRPMVSWYLRTSRILRTWGAVGGVVLPGAFALAWSGHLEILGVDAGGGVNPGDAGWIALPYDERWRGPSGQAVAGFLVWVLGLVWGLERLQRWLLRRPQPFTDPSLVAADDAIRSQSVHAVAGAGRAMLLLMFAGTSVLLASADVAVLRWTMWLPALAAAVLALVACQHSGQTAWRVRR